MFALIGCIAGYIQGVTGFGVGIIVTSLCSLYLPLYFATALAALCALLTCLIMMVAYRRSFNFRPVVRLLVGSVIGIPIGITVIRKIDGEIALTCLGIAIIGFSVASLLRAKLPNLPEKWPAYFFGFGSGLMSGAFSAGGPLVVMYALSAGWPERAYKSNLTGYLLINTAVLVGMHGFKGNLPTQHLAAFAMALPVITGAVLLGIWSAGRIHADTLKKIVLYILLVFGINYALTAF